MTDSHVMRFSVGIYGREPIMRAAYKFTDRCYLHITPDGEDVVLVEFRSRDSSLALSELIGQFSNEVLDQHVRATVLAETKGLRARIVAAAFGEGGITHQAADGDTLSPPA